VTRPSKAAPEPERADPGAADEDETGFIGPSTDPMTNSLLAGIALTGGLELARRGIEHGLLGKGYAPDKTRRLLKHRTLAQSLVGAALTRVALTSVPGAIVVGGGLLAKTLYDRRKNRAASQEQVGAGEADAADSPDGDETRGY
jgi:hypothetical protein